MARVRVRGAEEAAKILRDFAASIDRVTAEGMEQLAPIALSYANSLTPVRTGYLRSRNRAAVAVVKEGKVALTMSNDAPYARLVHDGTSRQAPHPFLSPVRDELVRAAPEIFRNGLAAAFRVVAQVL